MKLFAEKGYDATSIEEITATVGWQKVHYIIIFQVKKKYLTF